MTSRADRNLTLGLWIFTVGVLLTLALRKSA